MLCGSSGRRRKTVVEKALPRTGDGRHQAVEHLASLRIGIEPLVQEHPQRATALRQPLRNDPVHHRNAVQVTQRVSLRDVVLEKGDQVAHPRETGALHDRSPSLVHQLVDPSRLKSTIERHFEIDETAAGVAPVVAHPQLPGRPRDRLWRISLAQPLGQGGVRQVSNNRLKGELVRHRKPVGRDVGRQLSPDHPDDWNAIIRVEGYRSLKPQAAPGQRDLGDPAARYRHIAAAEEERFCSPCPPSAIVDDVEQGGLCLCPIHRHDDLDVTVELHVALSVGRGQIQIHDAGIRLIRGVERVDHYAANPLVGATLRGDVLTERLARGNVEPDDLRGHGGAHHYGRQHPSGCGLPPPRRCARRHRHWRSTSLGNRHRDRTLLGRIRGSRQAYTVGRTDKREREPPSALVPPVFQSLPSVSAVRIRL